MAATTKSVGIISANNLYTLAEIEARLGLGAAALREARHQGLKVRRVGRRSFVLGRELIAYVEKCGKEVE